MSGEMSYPRTNRSATRLKPLSGEQLRACMPAASIIPHTATAVGDAAAAVVRALQSVECYLANLVSYSHHGLPGQKQREFCSYQVSSNCPIARMRMSNCQPGPLSQGVAHSLAAMSAGAHSQVTGCSKSSSSSCSGTFQLHEEDCNRI